MEYVEGAALILLGVLIIIFGGASAASAADASRFALPTWLDNLLKWSIGLLCIWFGAALLRGHSHFF